MFVPWRKVGNSTGLILPKQLLVDSGFADHPGVDVTLEDGALVLRPPPRQPRSDWAQAAAILKGRAETHPLLSSLYSEQTAP